MSYQRTLGPPGNGTFALANATPTLDELFVSCPVVMAGTVGTDVTTAGSCPLFIAPYPLKIVQFSLSPWQGDVLTSDSSYWTMDLRRTRANTTVVIATKTTKTTGGSAFLTRTDWNFDSAAFDATNQQFQKGDILNIAFTNTGAPSPCKGPMVATTHYVPL